MDSLRISNELRAAASCLQALPALLAQLPTAPRGSALSRARAQASTHGLPLAALLLAVAEDLAGADELVGELFDTRPPQGAPPCSP